MGFWHKAFEAILGRDGVIRKFGRATEKFVTKDVPKLVTHLPGILASTVSGASTGASLGSIVGPEGTLAGLTAGALGGLTTGVISGLSGPDGHKVHQMDALLKKGDTVSHSVAKHLLAGREHLSTLSKAAAGGAFGQTVAQQFPSAYADKLDKGLAGVHSAVGQGRFALERFKAGVNASDPTAVTKTVLKSPEGLGQLVASVGATANLARGLSGAPHSIAYGRMVDRVPAPASVPVGPAGVTASSA